MVTDFATAELVKVAANAFLATKISFINAIAEVCEVTGADVVDLADASGTTTGSAASSSTPASASAAAACPRTCGPSCTGPASSVSSEPMSLLSQVDDINQAGASTSSRSPPRCSAAASPAPGSPCGARPSSRSTDDVRDSPALWIAGQLHLRGADVSVYDPKANDTARGMFPTLTYATDAASCARDADLLLHLTEWPEFAEVDPASASARSAGRCSSTAATASTSPPGGPPAGPCAASAAAEGKSRTRSRTP